MYLPNELQRVIKREGGLNRRVFLACGSALAAIPLLGRTAGAVEVNPSYSVDPFTLGVASGDPDQSSVVLWTRLAPEPLNPGGGMGSRLVQVQWEIAEDEAFTRVVAQGVEVATPQLAHSIHADATGLKPAAWYWYRFRSGEAVSPIGRTRTMPSNECSPQKVRFAVTSCQNYEQGWFTAYEQMARDQVDLVFHLGDYIYEYEAGRNGKVRTHIGQEIASLDDYRIRHAQYRLDPLLSGMHAQCPWIVTWDDHELDNNCASAISEEKGIDAIEFLVRRANAYQAYYEMMPLRSYCLPQGPDMRLYRQISFGQLANFMVLDTRQYRTDQPNDDKKSPLNEAALSANNTMLGQAQRGWLCQNLLQSRAIWNVLAQQVMMGQVGFALDGDELKFSMDQWPGYSFERERLLKFMAERRIPNPVVLTGDIHSNWANELRVNDRCPEESVVACEFVATSLSSGGDGIDQPKKHERVLADNVGTKFMNGQRGYLLCDVTPQSWRTDYIVVDQVTKPGGQCSSRAAFIVEAGDPSIKQA